MKNFKMISVLMLCAAVLLSGCGASNTVKGTAIGVGGGAAVGAGVGKIAGNTALGCTHIPGKVYPFTRSELNSLF